MPRTMPGYARTQWGGEINSKKKTKNKKHIVE